VTRQSQSARILERLQRGPATTWQIGPELNILSVTRRIFELRKQGYEIEMSEQWRGKTRICTYRLLDEQRKETAA